MNIALFTDSYPPQKSGVATCVWLEKQELEKQGHTVYLVLPKLQKHPYHDPTILELGSVSIAQKNDAVITLPDYNKIKKFLDNKKIDVVHTHADTLVAIAAVFWAKENKVPLVHTMHTHWKAYLKTQPVLNWLLQEDIIESAYRVFSKNCKTMIVPSQKALGLAERYKIRCPIRVLPNSAISLRPIQTREVVRSKLGIPGDAIIACVTGRISDEKRSLELFSAMTPVLQKEKQLYLVYIGDGVLRAKLEASVEEQNMLGRVVITGFVDGQEVVDTLHASDIYVTASVSEIHSVALLEALDAGLALITRTDAAYNDVVLHGENGYQENKDAGLAERMSELCKDPVKLKIMQSKSLSVSQRFTPEKHVQSLIDIYSSVLDKKRL